MTARRLYVPETPVELGDDITVLLRVPKTSSAGAVAVRYMRDGDPLAARAEVDRETDARRLVAGDVPRRQRRDPVSLAADGRRLRLRVGEREGRPDLRPRRTPTTSWVTPGEGGPDWHLESVVYQVFPDRFARSGRDRRRRPDWAVPRGVGRVFRGHATRDALQWFGGDLDGITEHLDHLAELGAERPLHDAGLPRREQPPLQRDDVRRGRPAARRRRGLRPARRAAHDAGWRVLGDLTTNHTGDTHEWFSPREARRRARARSFYYFDDRRHATRAGWATLAAEAQPRQRRAARAHGTTDRTRSSRRWLRAAVRPGRLADRRREHDRPARRRRRHPRGRPRPCARTATAAARRPRRRASTATTSRADLDGRRLARHDELRRLLAAGVVVAARRRLPPGGAALRAPGRLRSFAGTAIVRTMRAFRAGIPWSASLHSWAILDSHDSARFSTVVAGLRERQLVGVGLQMTTPGVPMVFAGDEIGLGATGVRMRGARCRGRVPSRGTRSA